VTLGHDELTRPLGLETARRPRRRMPLALGNLFVGGVATIFLVLAGYLVIVKDPYGGEPYATAPVTRSKPADPAASAATATEPRVREGAPPAQDSSLAMSEAEKATGVRVVRGTGDRAGGIVIQVPPSAVKLAPAPDKRLVDRSRHGVLPRIGADGARPADVYARPAVALPPKTVGRIAIVMGGLGLSQGLTNDAIQRLPGDVTLAFAPYGAELERQVSKARDDGHEVMLQVPMEPFDYPDNDPGPHTLTAANPGGENTDRLLWVMSRFPGYVGVMNHMGAKFTSSDAALAPVLKEIASRGLLLLDDGSSARSLMPAAAAGLKLPFAKADAVLDLSPKASSIDDQLARLETIARERGVSVGAASAPPVSIERIAAWAKGLEARGLALVPLSAAIAKPGRP
jgi:uncharacterized protein